MYHLFGCSRGGFAGFDPQPLSMAQQKSGEDPELPGRLRLAAHMCGQDCLRPAWGVALDVRGSG